MRQPWRNISYVTCLLSATWVAAVLLIALENESTLAQVQDPRANTSTRAASGGQRAANWNEARILAATPLPTPRVDPSKIKKGSPTPSTGGGPSSTSQARDLGQANPKISGDASAIPLRWAGKLFYHKPGGGDWICSGQFITNRVVLTAAHCLRDDDTGQWFDQFSFRLQYNRGHSTASYGWECVATKQGWVAHDDQWRWDVGMILVRDSSRTGYFGYHYGWPLTDYPNATKIGYPADILDGQVIQVDSGPLFFADDEEAIVGLRHGNRRNAGGSSGGAWVARYNSRLSANTNLVIGVTSHHRGDDTSISYSPYLEQANFRSLLDYTSRGCKN